MFHIIYGEDDYSIREFLDSLKKELGDPEAISVNTVLIDGEDIKPAELVEAIQSLPFLSDKRLVIVKNLLMRFQPKEYPQRKSRGTFDNKKREEKEIAQWLDLPKMVEQMSPSTVLVMIEGNLSEKNTLFNELKKLAKLKIFKEIGKQEMEAWIKKEASKRDLKIKPDALSLLVELVGSDLWMAKNEIDKLAAYSPAGTIDKAALTTLVSATWELNILRLVDDILEGKKAEALDLIGNLFKKGVGPGQLLSRIADQLQKLVRAKELPSDCTIEEGKSRLGIRSKSNYPYEKTMNQARAYSLERIKQIYRLLLDYDRGVKSGRYGEETGLEVMVTEIALLSSAKPAIARP